MNSKYLRDLTGTVRPETIKKPKNVDEIKNLYDEKLLKSVFKVCDEGFPIIPREEKKPKKVNFRVSLVIIVITIFLATVMCNSIVSNLQNVTGK